MLNINYLNKPRLVARIKGGLGNQLFCYSAARRLASYNNALLILDHVSGFSFDHTYRRNYALEHFNINATFSTPRERMEPLGRIRRKISLYKNNLLPFSERNYIQQEGLGFDSRLLTKKFRETLYLDGNWQSEDYFKDIESIIHQDLKITPPNDFQNQSLSNLILQHVNSVAIHVRWFDSPVHGKSILNLPGRYYTNAINFIERNIQSPRYFVFSDNISATKANISFPENRVRFVSHNDGDSKAFADLWLMTQCKHFILSNSTLNWWGGWLAKSRGLLVYPDEKCFSVEAGQYKSLFSAYLNSGTRISGL
jgi:hypothetical protein